MNVFSFHESLEMFVERSIYPSQRKNLKKQWIQFLSTLEIVHPLKPRKAFLGGRINALTLHYVVDVSEGQQIEYVDFTSLYPWVKRNGEHPVGYPTLIVHPDDQDIRQIGSMVTHFR